MQRNKYERNAEVLSAILKSCGMKFCEYMMKEDRLIFYDDTLTVEREIPHYMKYLQDNSSVHPEDRWIIKDFYQGKIRGEAIVRILMGKKMTKLLFQVLPMEGTDLSVCLPILAKDITREKDREALLEQQAMKDSLTSLYNHFFGKELINEYLKNKDPYATCGMMVLDVDYFKHANDIYGHLFGDQVLVELAHLLVQMFDERM